MKALLDTCTFLWLVTEDCSHLNSRTADIFLSEDSEIYFSLVSAWEISIKNSMGKLQLTDPVYEFLTKQIRLNDLNLLPIEISHIAKVSELPFHHKDPFDRLLIAQSVVENIPILTQDRIFAEYGVEVM